MSLLFLGAHRAEMLVRSLLLVGVEPSSAYNELQFLPGWAAASVRLAARSRFDPTTAREWKPVSQWQDQRLPSVLLGSCSPALSGAALVLTATASPDRDIRESS